MLNGSVAGGRPDFNPEEYSNPDLRTIKEAQKKGFDSRYCLLGIKSKYEKYRDGVQEIFEVLEFEREEGLPEGTILRQHYDGYNIFVRGVVREIREKRERDNLENSVEGYFRRRGL